MNSITQDISKTSAGVRTISLRLAGTEEAKGELAELGEDVDDFIVQTNSKTQQIIKDYTAVASNAYKGVDVLDANGNLRNTYDILLDIAKVYQEIIDTDKKAGTNRAQALVEAIAGKNRSNIASSILLNPELLEDVYETAQNSANSAFEENEKYLNSITGKLNILKNDAQQFVFDLVSSDLLKWLLDVGDAIIKIADNLVNASSIIPTLGGIAGGILSIKGNGIGEGIIDMFKSVNDTIDHSAIEKYNTLLAETGDALKSCEIATKGQNSATTQLIQSAGIHRITAQQEATAVQSLGVASKITTIATTALKAALEGLLLFAVASAITFLIKQLDKIANAEKYAAQAADDAKNSISSLKSEMDSLSDSTETLGRRYAELAQGIDQVTGKNISLTTDEYEEFLDVSNELADLYPTLTKGYDENGNAILDLSGDVNTITSSLKNMLDVQREIYRQDIEEKIPDLLPDFNNKYNDYNKDIKNYKHYLDGINKGHIQFDYDDIDLFNEYSKALTESGLVGENLRIDNALLTIDLDIGDVNLKNVHDVLAGVTKDVNSELHGFENNLKQETSKVSNYINTWLQGDWAYIESSDLEKQIVQQSLLSGDMIEQAIKEGIDTTDWNALSTWIRNSFIQSLHDMSPETQTAITTVFSPSQYTIEEIKNAWNDLLLFFGGEENLPEWLKGRYSDIQSKSYVNTDSEGKNEYLKSLDETESGYRRLEILTNDFKQEQWDAFLKATEGAENATDAIKKYVDTINSAKEGTDDLAASVSEIAHNADTLDLATEIYNDVQDGEDFDFGRLVDTGTDSNPKFKDIFGGSQEYDELLRKIMESPDAINNSQEAWNGLITKWVYASDALKKVSEENKLATIKAFEQKGIKNAKEIVEWQLKENKAAQDYKNKLRGNYDALMDFEDGFDDLIKKVEKWNDLQKKNSNLSLFKDNPKYDQYLSKLNSLKSILQDLSGTDVSITQTEAFAKDEENLVALEQALLGDEEAIKRVKVQLAELQLMKYHPELDLTDFQSQMNGLLSWIEEHQGDSAIEFQAGLDANPFWQMLKKVIQQGGQAAAAIKKMFADLGWDLDWEMKEIPITYEGTGSQVNDLGSEQGRIEQIARQRVVHSTGKIKVPTNFKFKQTGSSGPSANFTPTNFNAPTGGGNGGGNGGGGGGSDSESQEETFDWIETKISRVERDIENLGNIIENVYKSWEERNQAIIDQYNKIGEEIEIQQAAYQRYLQELNNVGLDPVWAEKVRNGQINIDTITDNKDLVDKINKYKEIYDKVIAAADAVEGLRTSQFDLMQKDFDNMIQRYADAEEFRQIGRDMADALWDAMQDSAVIIPEMIAQHYMDANHTLMEGIAADDLKIAEMTAQRARMVEAGIAGQAITDIDKQIAEAQKARLEKEIQLSQNIAQVYIDQFDNIQNRYQNVTNDIQHTINKINTLRDTAEAQGYATSSYFLEALRNENDGLLTQAASEYNTLKQHLEVAVGSGAITEGSKQWYDLMDQIQEKYERILELQKEGADITKQLRDLEWERFDKSSDALSKWREDNNFLIDILSYEDELFEDIDRDIIHDLMERLSDVVEDEGGLNIEPAIRFDDAGMAVMGLHVSNLDAYHDEIGRVDTAIEEYRKQLEASGNADEDLKERLEEQIKLRQDLTKSYYDERQAIVSLWKTYYDKMLDYLQKVIDKRKEALSAEKDLYDYEKNIRNQTRDISNLEKQLMAIQGDTSEEAMNKRMKLEQQLQDAQEKLQETEYDRWKQDQETMLDNLMQDYTELTEDILKDIDTLINKTIEQTKANTTSTNETIKNLINGEEGSVTQAIGGVKNALETSLSDKNFKERIIGDGENSINTHLKKIDDFTQNFYKEADRNAKVSTNTVNENEQRNSDEKDYSSAYRLYNSSTGQHLWTNNAGERDMLAGSGWTEEGSTKMWANSTLPIYRLSSPTGDHLYTIDKNESASLKKNGWNLDGILGYANDDGTGEQVYRLYNPNNGQHFFTVDRSEYESLKALGWNDETNKNFKISTDIFKGEALSAAAFAKGGEIASQYGEDGWLLARKGEHILSLEQIKEMKDVLKAYNPLADAIKGVHGTTGFSAGASIENMSLTLNLPNVTNYDEFKAALKNDSNFAQWMSEATIGQIAGHGSLSKYRF